MFNYGLTSENGQDTVHEFQSRGSDPWSWDPNRTICGEYITYSCSMIKESMEMCNTCFPFDTSSNVDEFDVSLVEAMELQATAEAAVFHREVKS